MAPPRDDRRHGSGGVDQRLEGQRDRDRILYCSALRRLAGVTQVASADEGCIFHNRLTHTLETAQIGRRLAEKFLHTQGDLAARLGDVDPDVVEAAALSHDLGHAPFGHAGEAELNDLAIAAGLADGFEGNAQSFRIITRLAAHRPRYKGLNLTRATLRACMKYPWHKDVDNPGSKHDRKYSAYRSDGVDFEWAMDGSGGTRSLEAEIMDLADDIAYSVHDLEDFVRGGLISLYPLRNTEYRERFLEDWLKSGRVTQPLLDANRHTVQNWITATALDLIGDGTFAERAALKEQSAGTIGRYIGEATLQEPDANGRRIAISSESRFLMRFSQRIVWEFVISGSRLASQQYGHRRVLRDLFHIYRQAIETGSDAERSLIPRRFLTEFEELDRDAPETSRLAIDIVASFTDQQAVLMFRRLTGVDVGSVTDLVNG